MSSGSSKTWIWILDPRLRPGRIVAATHVEDAVEAGHKDGMRGHIEPRPHAPGMSCGSENGTVQSGGNEKPAVCPVWSKMSSTKIREDPPPLQGLYI